MRRDGEQGAGVLWSLQRVVARRVRRAGRPGARGGRCWKRFSHLRREGEPTPRGRHLSLHTSATKAEHHRLATPRERLPYARDFLAYPTPEAAAQGGGGSRALLARTSLAAVPRWGRGGALRWAGFLRGAGALKQAVSKALRRVIPAGAPLAAFIVAGQCDVPADLGPVVAVAGGGAHTCAVKASGELVCFGWNFDGQCAVPADLGAVAVAGWELVRFGAILGLTLTVSATCRQTWAAWAHSVFREAPLRIQSCSGASRRGCLGDPSRRGGRHSGSAGSLAHRAQHPLQQLAGEAGGAPSAGHNRFCRVLLLEFSRSPPELNEVLEQSIALQPTREALAREGYSWRQPTGAKVGEQQRPPCTCVGLGFRI